MSPCQVPYELWWVSDNESFLLRIAADIGHPEMIESAVRRLGAPMYPFQIAIRFDDDRVYLEWQGPVPKMVPAEDGYYTVTDGHGHNFGRMRVDHNLDPIVEGLCEP